MSPAARRTRGHRQDISRLAIMVLSPLTVTMEAVELKIAPYYQRRNVSTRMRRSAPQPSNNGGPVATFVTLRAAGSTLRETLRPVRWPAGPWGDGRPSGTPVLRGCGGGLLAEGYPLGARRNQAQSRRSRFRAAPGHPDEGEAAWRLYPSATCHTWPGPQTLPPLPLPNHQITDFTNGLPHHRRTV
jgi:hypothetical protein